MEKNFGQLEGKSFVCANVPYNITTAYQRTAFILDESGAEVESEVVFEAATEAAEEIIKPKRLVFDGPFLVLLKRTDAQHPYFTAWMADTTLLKPL